MNLQPDVLDERDLALINAIQISPRAPWSQIGHVLDVDAVTVARRWSRLVEDGIAWLTVHPSIPRAARVCMVFVEVCCATNRAIEAAKELSRNPRVGFIEHVTGGYDLGLLVFVAGIDKLSDFLLDEIAQVPGVLATKSYVATESFADGDKWQLGSLDPDQQRSLRSVDSAPVGAPILESDVRELMHAMSDDCRISVSDLAVRLGVSRATARRRMDTALAHRQLVIRCDVAHAIAGIPLVANLRTSVPSTEQTVIGRAIGRMRETRLSAGLTGGPSNLLISFGLRSHHDLHKVEVMLEQRFPRLRVMDRVVVLRMIKSFGRILDATGRATSQVVLDPWDSTPPPASPERIVSGQ